MLINHNKKIIIIIIKSLILYCVTWTSCCSHDNINKIFKLQKRCVRLILDAQKRHSSVDLFNTLGWVPYYIAECDIKKGLLAYKRIMGACPDYISDLLELIINSRQHSINTRGANLNILPRRFNRVKERGPTFSVTTSKCWNHLPLRIRASSSVNFLKNALYKHLKLSKIGDSIFTPFLSNRF